MVGSSEDVKSHSVTLSCLFGTFADSQVLELELLYSRSSLSVIMCNH